METAAYPTADLVERIERSGGWRLVMQGRTKGFEAVATDFDRTDIRGHPVACLAIAFYLAKCGDTKRSRSLIDEFTAAGRRGAIANLPALDPELALVDIHVKIYEDRVMGEQEERLLRNILQKLPPTDYIARALAMNHLCTVALHLGALNRSQSYAENAMHAYLVGRADYGAVHLHAHLGQIRLARGDITGAEQEYRTMEERLACLPNAPPDLVSVCWALRSEVAYEMNDIQTSRELLKAALGAVEGHDAWLDVLAAAYRVSTRLAFLESGLPGALSALAHAEKMAAERGLPRLQRLMRVERIRVFTLSDEIHLAREEIIRAGLYHLTRVRDWDEVGDWAILQGSTAVALSRFLVRAGRYEQALAVLDSAEDHAIHGGQMLAVAKLRIIRASTVWCQKERRAGVKALVSAVHLLGKQPFRRFILDEGPELQTIVQAALDGIFAEPRSNALMRNRLAELSHHWVVHSSSLRRTGSTNVQDSSGRPKGSNYTAQYLNLVAIGLSNKEIARTLGVSTNTVKYHLKNIFKELHVDNRLRAIQRARELEII